MDSDSAVTDAATSFGSSCCFAAAAAEEADSAETDADANPFLKQHEKVSALSDHPAGQKLSPVMDKDTKKTELKAPTFHLFYTNAQQNQHDPQTVSSCFLRMIPLSGSCSQLFSLCLSFQAFFIDLIDGIFLFYKNFTHRSSHLLIL